MVQGRLFPGCQGGCSATAQWADYAATPGAGCPRNVCCSQYGFLVPLMIGCVLAQYPGGFYPSSRVGGEECTESRELGDLGAVRGGRGGTHWAGDGGVRSGCGGLGYSTFPMVSAFKKSLQMSILQLTEDPDIHRLGFVCGKKWKKEEDGVELQAVFVEFEVVVSFGAAHDQQTIYPLLWGLFVRSGSLMSSGPMLLMPMLTPPPNQPSKDTPRRWNSAWAAESHATTGSKLVVRNQGLSSFHLRHHL